MVQKNMVLSMQGCLFLLVLCIYHGFHFTVMGAVVEMIVPPTTTNAQITQCTEDYYLYYNPDVIDYANPKVLIMLPGTWGKPSNFQLFLHRAANTGYLAVGLSYINDESIHSYCKQSVPNCYWDTRRTIILGQQFPESQIVVSPDNSILSRIYSLLIYLVNNDSSSGINYASLLSSNYQSVGYVNALLYERMSFGGLSQGGGMATVIGYMFNTSRILMFSSTVDDGINGYYWTQEYLSTCNTSLNRFIGLVASHDFVGDGVVNNWRLEQVNGTLVNIPQNSVGYGNSHMLCSTYLSGLVDCFKAHGSTVNDLNTPRAISTGSPFLSDTWKYMLTLDVDAPVDTTSLSVCDIQECNIRLSMFLMCFTPISLGLFTAFLTVYTTTRGSDTLLLPQEKRTWRNMACVFLCVLMLSVGPSTGVVFVYFTSQSRYLFYYTQVTGALVGINAGVFIIFIISLKYFIGNAKKDNFSNSIGNESSSIISKVHMDM